MNILIIICTYSNKIIKNKSIKLNKLEIFKEKKNILIIMSLNKLMVKHSFKIKYFKRGLYNRNI